MLTGCFRKISTPPVLPTNILFILYCQVGYNLNKEINKCFWGGGEKKGSTTKQNWEKLVCKRFSSSRSKESPLIHLQVD